MKVSCMEEEYCIPPDGLRQSSPKQSSNSSIDSIYSSPSSSGMSSPVRNLNEINGSLNHLPESAFQQFYIPCQQKDGNASAKQASGCDQTKGSQFEQIDTTLSLSEQPWFYGSIGRRLAETLLTNQPVGTFLVRDCESNCNQLSLSLCSATRCVHMRIQKNRKGQFVLGHYSQPFNSIPQMLAHYMTSVLPIQGEDRMMLRKPYTTSHINRTSSTSSTSSSNTAAAE